MADEDVMEEQPGTDSADDTDVQEDNTPAADSSASDSDPSAAGPNGVIGALSGAPGPPLPDLGAGNTARPGYAGNINGQTGQALPNNPPDPKRPWQAILKGALDGIANAGHAHNFAQGFSAGAEGELKQEQVDKANKRADDQLAMEQQRTMDEHQVAQAQLAMSHIQQQNLVREYNLAPKSTQDILDQISMKAGQDAKDTPGSSIVGTFGTYAEAQARATVEMKAKSENPFSVQVYHNAQGGFDVIDVPNANKPNESQTDVVIGYDFNSKKPITKTFAPGTITYAQKTQMETNAASKIADASNAMEEFKAKTDIEQNTPTAKAQRGLIASEVQKNKAEAQKAILEAGNAGTQKMWDYGKNPVSGESLNLSNAPDEFMVDSRTGQPVPQKMLSTLKPTQQESNRSDFAGSVLHSLDQIDQLRAAGTLPNGPLSGLTAKALSKAGLGDEDAQKALNFISFAQSAATGAHVGGRFSSEIMDKMNHMISLNMNDSQFKGAEDSIRNVMQQYVKQGGRETVSQYKQNLMGQTKVLPNGQKVKVTGFDSKGNPIVGPAQ